jgi:hypothetical protein
LEDEEENDVDKCEEDSAVLSDHDSVSVVGDNDYKQA